MKQTLRGAVILGVAMFALAAQAKTVVRGTPKAVSVVVEGETVEGVFRTLKESFDVTLHASAGIEKQLTGTYEGSLHQVVRRLLDGYDFVIATRNAGLEITVLSKVASAATTKKPASAMAATPQAAQPAAAIVPVTAAAPPVIASQDENGPRPIASSGPVPEPQPGGPAPAATPSDSLPTIVGAAASEAPLLPKMPSAAPQAPQPPTR